MRADRCLSALYAAAAGASFVMEVEIIFFVCIHLILHLQASRTRPGSQAPFPRGFLMRDASLQRVPDMSADDNVVAEPVMEPSPTGQLREVERNAGGSKVPSCAQQGKHAAPSSLK
jgi:hypothetical protein